MTIRLSDLPEAADGPACEAGLGLGTHAILTEIATLLERLAVHGEPSAIDLKSLPMSPADREQLLDALGDGEVRATIEADGTSLVRETAISGVWWLEYRNAAGELVAEFIEMTRVPEILTVEAADVGLGVERLRARIAGDRS